MYALKHLKSTTDGRNVEESTILGDFYRLEFAPADAGEAIAARVEYSNGADVPCIEIRKNERAFITTLTGDTVRIISRGA